MNVNLADIPKAFHLPNINWQVVNRWVEKNVVREYQFQAWSAIAEQWLAALDQALGFDTYRAVHSGRLLLFAPCDFTQTDAVLDVAVSGLGAIVSALGDLACASWCGPLVVLLFKDVETYDEYVQVTAPEAGLENSGGVCFREGYLHVAIKPTGIDELQRVVLHELTHACLCHLTLPRWLEEGITQLAEEAAVPNWRRFRLDSQASAELKRYWRERGLSDFWWGGGFSSYDDGQSKCYQLAEVLFRFLVADHRACLVEFVRHAHADDAGEGASVKYLCQTLAQLSAQFFGPGKWDARPFNSETYCRRGGLYLSRKEPDLALRDFDEALRMEPKDYYARMSRGFANRDLGKFEEATEDLHQAIKLNPMDTDARNCLAWILATCPDEEYRDGVWAIELAMKACELSGFSNWICLDTLAAAHAEAGDFDEAERWLGEALRLAPEDEQVSCRETLEDYRNERPTRDPRA